MRNEHKYTVCNFLLWFIRGMTLSKIIINTDFGKADKENVGYEEKTGIKTGNIGSKKGSQTD